MFCTQAPKQIWEEYRQAGSWVRLPQRVMEGACEGKRKASEERQTRATRKGTVFLRFPAWRVSRAPRSLIACLRLPEKREKNSAIYAGLVYG